MPSRKMANFSPSNCSIFSVFPEELAFGHAQLSTCCICCGIGRDVEQVPSMFQVCIHFLSPFLGSVAAMGCMYWHSPFSNAVPTQYLGYTRPTNSSNRCCLLETSLCQMQFAQLPSSHLQLTCSRWREDVEDTHGI